ncbi:MAG: ATP-binding cassette domain-containing protein [Clostridiales bacterium]|nr:ATP-binding cassette domain-containing protein [Clostridiales bacterium]
MPKVEVINFTKDYGYGRGVFDISFNIDEGEVFGFLGPNGSGKSTTIRHLMGFSKPDKGLTRILGLDSFKYYYKFMDKVGYLPGEIAVPEGLNGYEFLDMMKKLKKAKDQKWIDYLREVFELDLCGEIKRMSLGDKRKLAVVTAFMNDPEILILDEPTSGLDLATQQVFIEFIKNEKKRGKTILLSSHIFSEVDVTCDRIAIIKEGKIVNEFVAKDLKHSKNKNYLVEFNSREDLNEFLAENSNNQFKIVSRENNRIIINIDDNHINSLIYALSRSKFKGFNHLKETLEEYFMKYYKEDKDFGGVA